MRRILLGPFFLALSEAWIIFGIKTAVALMGAFFLAAIIGSWIVANRYYLAENWLAGQRVDAANAQDDAVVEPAHAAPVAGWYYVGLLNAEGRQVGPRKRARVAVDDGVSFPYKIELPAPDLPYASVAVWEVDESFGHDPLVVLNAFLVPIEDQGTVLVVGG